MKKSGGAKNIRVFIRVRPPMGREVEGKHTFNNLVLDPADPMTCSITRPRDGAKEAPKFYKFNHCYGPKARNDEIYKDFAQEAVEAAFNGQHGVLFMYGQTGSGKTFTVSNDAPNDLGVLQQAMRETWTRISQDREHEYRCTLSYTQLYKEQLTNLLDEKKDKVRLQSGNDGAVVLVREDNGVSVDIDVNSYQDTMALFKQGMSRKEMASTDMNQTSSRSHTIFAFTVSKHKRIGPIAAHDNVDMAGPAAMETIGKLYLCDLAGSERASKSRATGNALDEAASINGSLLVLGKVVAALTDKGNQHAPFRESKLTRLLQYSLSGNGNTSIMINCSPSDDNTEETLSAIYFGQRAIQIKQDAKKHQVLDYKALYLQLQADLDAKNDKVIQQAINDEVQMYEGVVANLKEQLAFAENQNKLLTQENDRLKKAGGGGGGGGISGADAEQYKRMIEELRQALKQRDEKLALVDSDRSRATSALEEERAQSFKLAEKLKAVVLKFQSERNDWSSQRMSMMHQLNSSGATDYLNPGGGPGEEGLLGNLQMQPVPPGEDPAPYLQSHIEKLQNTILAYQEDRATLLMYQEKSQKAIRALAADNHRLGGKMGSSSKGP